MFTLYQIDFVATRKAMRKSRNIYPICDSPLKGDDSQHCCNIVSNGCNIVPTLQHCVMLKSSLRIVPCNITLRDRRGAASRQNHRSRVWTDAVSGMVFAHAQNLSGIWVCVYSLRLVTKRRVINIKLRIWKKLSFAKEKDAVDYRE